MPPKLELKLRLLQDDAIAMGPGKADLLEAIVRTGSISGAGRALEMSYRRTWQLVDLMNRCFKEPLVRSAVGGQKGGGAQVTALGMLVLQRYRAMEAAAQAAAQVHAEELIGLLSEDRPSAV
nr:LysR family transcriptional regulator [uncultured Massilia sp.]